MNNFPTGSHDPTMPYLYQGGYTGTDPVYQQEQFPTHFPEIDSSIPLTVNDLEREIAKLSKKQAEVVKKNKQLKNSLAFLSDIQYLNEQSSKIASYNYSLRDVHKRLDDQVNVIISLIESELRSQRQL